MFKNLFQRKSVTSPVSPEGERRLAEVRAKLNELRSNYAIGMFSGHPEDIEEMIADYETVERDLVRAKRRGWFPDTKVINDIKDDMDRQKEYMLGKSYPESSIELEMSYREDQLAEAIIGLR